MGNGWCVLMEWEGKTIYDFLNFAKEEAVKINVIRKEMENELERIKLIGKESEVVSEEVMKSVYIARDRDSEMYMYLSKPIRIDGTWSTKDGEHFDLGNVDVKLPYIAWEDEPLEYRMLGTEITEEKAIKTLNNFNDEMVHLMRKYGVKSFKPYHGDSEITQQGMAELKLKRYF